MSAITTHVLDSVAGGPRAGMGVRLETEDGRLIAAAKTDADGRVRDLGPDAVDPGTYRLTFHTEGEFYPEIVVTFALAERTEHCHVPLLLSAYSYTTYRGS